MRTPERLDLADLDLATLPRPPKGERTIRDTEAEALGLRLRASGSRTWVLLTIEQGRTVRKSLGDAGAIPLASARRTACALAGEISETPADPPSSGPRFEPDVRVAALLADYLAFGARGRWKASTTRQMTSIANTAILPQLEKRPVAEISRQEVAQWHRDVLARTTSARMALSTLSGLMLYAEDHGIRPPGSNPCQRLRKKDAPHRGRQLPPLMVRNLWQALDRLRDAMPDACDAVRLLLLTGARRGEILGLRWDDIAGARAVLEDSKTGRQTIWLNAPARGILDARRESANGPFVFPAPRRDGPMTVIDRQWTAIRRTAGLGTLRLHDLRHHYASVAVSNGIDLRIVGQLLGHHDLDSTLGYAHLATGALVKSASRVSGLIDRSLKGAAPVRSQTRPRPAGAPPIAETTRAVEARHG